MSPRGPAAGMFAVDPSVLERFVFFGDSLTLSPANLIMNAKIMTQKTLAAISPGDVLLFIVDLMLMINHSACLW
jgi:hypothetical protein